VWRKYLLAGINLNDYGVGPFDAHRLTENDLRAIQAHHRALREAANG
jgi:hypothetical protein